MGRIIIRGRVQKDYQNLIFTDLTNLTAKIDIFSLIVPRLLVKRSNCQGISSHFIVVY
ncbi:protein of unknown function [Streptococcus thermophilus]|uniref:Uncharacterized protein n=1 Tax=Streptococcus thermophilus TaxID=1308 RepID=A0AAU9H9E9_STRTR|nr:protein of unknown function [Streptococcus thermophilus]CAD0156794.1 protein of unknown function [Streptococcus thermophilus]